MDEFAELSPDFEAPASELDAARRNNDRESFVRNPYLGGGKAVPPMDGPGCLRAKGPGLSCADGPARLRVPRIGDVPTKGGNRSRTNPRAHTPYQPLDAESLDDAFAQCPAGHAFDSLRGILAPALSPQALEALPDEELVAWVASVESLGSVLDSARAFLAAAVVARGDRSVADDSARLAATRLSIDPFEVGDARDAESRSPEDLQVVHRSANLAARTGCRNGIEIAERLTGVSARTVKARVASAKHLLPRISLGGDVISPPFPILAAATQAGALSGESTQLIAQTLGRLDDARVHPGDLEAAEIGLVAVAAGRDHEALEKLAARGAFNVAASINPEDTDHDRASAFLALPANEDGPFTLTQLRIAAKAWALAIDPDGTLPNERTASTKRGVTLGRVRDGLIPLQGRLEPEVAAQLTKLFDAYLNPKSDSADDDPAVVDERTWDQKRHDALAGILTAAAANRDGPLLGGAPPVLVVTVDADQLDSSGVAFIQGHHPHTGHDGEVRASAALHIGCTGAIQRVVTDPNGRILSLSAPQRVFTHHQRRAIIARDGGCVVPGCMVPATWCEIHHVQSWKDGGATHTDNGVLLCWHHHRNLDTLGWTIAMEDGVPTLTPAPHALRPFQPTRPQVVDAGAALPRHSVQNLRYLRNCLVDGRGAGRVDGGEYARAGGPPGVPSGSGQSGVSESRNGMGVSRGLPSRRKGRARTSRAGRRVSPKRPRLRASYPRRC